MMMQMPDNQEAIDLLKDMVATDTFVFGSSSWVTASKLFKIIQSAQRAGSFTTLTKGTDLEIESDDSGPNMIIAKVMEEEAA